MYIDNYINANEIHAEICRAWGALKETAPASETYLNLIKSISIMADWIEPSLSQAEYTPVEAAKPVDAPDPDKTAKPKAKKEKAAAPAPEEEPVTKEFVRELLSKAAEAGLVDIPAFIAKFIPEGKDVKFSNIPPAQYGTLVKELEKYAR